MAHSSYTSLHLEEDVKQMKGDIKGMKDDIRGIKGDIKKLIEQTGAGRVLQYLQQSPGTSTSRQGENPDMMSDTASTLSTGSEGEEARQNVNRAKCMSEAIQCQFKEIVRRVPFDGLVDEVLAKGVVTVQENERIREFEASTDKMRYLVRNVMSKDYETMILFLRLINEYDPNLRNDIVETFNIRHQDDLPKKYSPTCTVCLIKKRIGIKIVCDHFFSCELITGTLHRDITDCSASSGNDVLWRRLFEELSKANPEHIRHIMKDLLTDGEGEQVSHYADIIKIIDMDNQRRRKSFRCRCQSHRKRPLPVLQDTGPESALSQNRNNPTENQKKVALSFSGRGLSSSFPISKCSLRNNTHRESSAHSTTIVSTINETQTTEDRKPFVPYPTWENLYRHSPRPRQSAISNRSIRGQVQNSEDHSKSREPSTEDELISTKSRHTQSAVLEDRKKSNTSVPIRPLSSPLPVLRKPEHRRQSDEGLTQIQNVENYVHATREAPSSCSTLSTPSHNKSTVLEDQKKRNSSTPGRPFSSPFPVSRRHSPNNNVKGPTFKARKGIVLKKQKR